MVAPSPPITDPFPLCTGAGAGGGGAAGAIDTYHPMFSCVEFFVHFKTCNSSNSTHLINELNYQ